MRSSLDSQHFKAEIIQVKLPKNAHHCLFLLLHSNSIGGKEECLSVKKFEITGFFSKDPGQTQS